MIRPSCIIAVAVAAIALALPAYAQRSAVSADLSPEAAAESFTRTILDVCVPAIAGNGVSSLAAAREGRVQPTQDAATRRQAGAGVGETVWDVSAARGVVTVSEAQATCSVSVYGPPAAPTIMAAMSGLSALGFEALAGPAFSGFAQTLAGASGGKRMTVQLGGIEPGAPGHQSKFSVVTATVSVAR